MTPITPESVTTLVLVVSGCLVVLMVDGFSLDGATDEGVTQLSSISLKSVKLLKMHKKFSKFLEKLFLLVYDQGKIIPARKSASRLIKLIFSQTSATHCTE